MIETLLGTIFGGLFRQATKLWIPLAWPIDPWKMP